jgi:DNA-binding transcriptional regulator YdaS (Cro superfamily)
MSAKKHINQLIREVGSQAELARQLGIVRSNISHWIRNNRIPAAQALMIERIFGVDAQLLTKKRRKS